MKLCGAHLLIARFHVCVSEVLKADKHRVSLLTSRFDALVISPIIYKNAPQTFELESMFDL